MLIKKMSVMVLSAMVLLSAGCGKFRRSDAEKGSPKEAYVQWVTEVEKSKGNPDKVVELYAKDAILLPTLSPVMCTSKKMITNYMVHFLSMQDMQVETKELITRKYGDIAMATGFYNFTFTKNGKKMMIRARFDFWYKLEEGNWKIIFHQSSIVPNGK